MTVLSQQTRALNLICALQVNGIIPSNGKLAVIGGGVAGITAAAAAHSAGLTVTLFEHKKKLMGLFRESHRYLHPYLFDWPEPVITTTNALLPIMNWYAGGADDVFKQLNAEWSTKFGAIDVRSGVTLRDDKCRWDDLPPHLEWTETFEQRVPHDLCGDFDAVIVAVGFGTERDLTESTDTCSGVVKSYWLNDDLEQPHPTRPIKRVLVSGCGDSGVIDYLRATLRSYTSEFAPKLLALLGSARFGKLREQIRLLERRLRSATAAQWPAEAMNGYKRIRNEEIDEFIRAYRREDTEVVLNARSPSHLSPQANALNRFLLSRMAPNYRSGIPVIERKSGSSSSLFRVSFGEQPPEDFDQVVIRRGPTSAIADIKGIGSRVVWRQADDSTRHPLYGSFYWRLGSARPLTDAQAVVQGYPEGEFKEAPDFAAREEELRQIEHTLYTIKTAVVVGFPGVGKTEIAKQYIHRHRRDYESIFWISGKNETSIIAAFSDIIASLALPQTKAEGDELIPQPILDFLQNRTDWLCVVDNVNASLIDRLSFPNSGHILMTCVELPKRFVAFEGTINLSMLEVNAGSEFLLRAVTPPVASVSPLRNAAVRLSRALDGLPRALIRAGLTTVENYRQLAETIERLADPSADFSDSHSQVAPLVEVSQAIQPVLEVLTDKTVDLLRLCAFLDPESIPREMLVDSSMTPSSIEEATRWSLIQASRDDDTVRLPRLLQLAIRKDLSPQDRKIWASRAVDVTSRTVTQRALPVRKARMRYGAQLANAERLLVYSGQSISEQARGLLQVAAEYSKDRGWYAAAAEREERLDALLRDALGRSITEGAGDISDFRWQLAQTLLRRGGLATRLGYFQPAREAFDEALELVSDNPSKSDVLVSKIHSAYGWLQFLNGFYQSAEDHYRLALEAWPVSGPEAARPAEAMIYNNAGRLEYACGRYGTALAGYDKATAIRADAQPLPHRDSAQTLNNLGLLFLTLGNLEEAADRLGAAYRMSIHLEGPGHPETASIQNNLGLLAIERGDNDAALSYLTRAREVMEQVTKGKANISVAQSLNLLAQTYLAKGDFRSSVWYAAKALRMRRGIFGPRHPYTASARCTLGRAYTLFNIDRALPHLDLALAIRRTTLKHHPEIAESLDALSLYYLARNDWKAARQWCRECLAELASVPEIDKGHPLLVKCHQRLAELDHQARVSEGAASVS